MHLLKSSIFILLTIALFASCSTDGMDQDDLAEGDLNFYFGSFGGFCGYSDSLSILSNLDTHFDLEVFCDDTDFENSQNIEKTEYDALVNSFLLSDFKSLNHNSCARCADGTDNFLHIVGSDFRHRIVFSHGNDVRSIQNLITELESIREAHQPE